MTIGRYYLRRL